MYFAFFPRSQHNYLVVHNGKNRFVISRSSCAYTQFLQIHTYYLVVYNGKNRFVNKNMFVCTSPFSLVVSIIIQWYIMAKIGSLFQEVLVRTHNSCKYTHIIQWYIMAKIGSLNARHLDVPDEVSEHRTKFPGSDEVLGISEKNML